MEEFLKKINNFKTEIDYNLKNLSLSDHPVELYQPMRYSLDSPGKRLRPIMLLVIGKAFEGNYKQLMNAALAVEILHTFTLVHDDIMDSDSLRRGKPTVHVKWDKSTAILSGDALMALAFQTLMKVESSEIKKIGLAFSTTMLEICEGQAQDMQFAKEKFISSGQYLKMVGKKTGNLLALSSQLGALISNCDPNTVDEMYNFGMELGLAFQIQDDLLEITSNEEKMGKSLGSDFALGKKTYPLISALEKIAPGKREFFLQFLKENTNNREIIHNEFNKNGCIEESERLVQNLFKNVNKRIKIFPQKIQDELTNLITIISRRKS